MLEKHVPSLELCKKWKELGGRQDTCLVWISIPECFPEWEVDTRRRDRELAAPLASEMMEWLKGKFDDLNFYSPEWSIWFLEGEEPTRFTDKSLPNALMKMCIARKEEEENGKG